MTNAKSISKKIFRSLRIKARLNAAGITTSHKRRLMRMTNVRMASNGRLADATCHYRNAWEVTGNTYGIRDVIKSVGGTWDAENKCWVFAGNLSSDSFLPALCRAIATK